MVGAFTLLFLPRKLEEPDLATGISIALLVYDVGVIVLELYCLRCAEPSALDYQDIH